MRHDATPCHAMKQVFTLSCRQVHGEDVVQVAQIVREGMEGAAALAVPTPVRVQVGASWGSLRTFHL